MCNNTYELYVFFNAVAIYSTATIPSIPHGIAMSDDVGFAKDCAKVIYYFRFVIEKMDRVYRLMHQAAFCFGYAYLCFVKFNPLGPIADISVMEFP